MSREKVVKILDSWLGLKEADGSHKRIIDIYNKISPLPAGYKMKYTDAWCAATASAAFHEAGLDQIFPSECSCSRMIEKAKKMGVWVENDAFIPQPGDAVLYDWQDSGIGDNTGAPDHVGIVKKVEAGYIYVIEGNYSDSVKIRKLQINGKYIRGFVTPKFTASSAPQKKPMQNGKADAGVIFSFFTGKGCTEIAAAAIEGNLEAESGLKPTNLQNSFEKKLGLMDEEYTTCVDEGIYTNFVKDSAGYGLAQWTYHTRKEALKKFADQANASIGNLQMQLDFLWQELSTSYKGVLTAMNKATSVREASDIFLMQFERPADQGEAVQKKRAEFGLKYYHQFAKGQTPAPAPAPQQKEVKATDPAQKMDKAIAGSYKTSCALHLRAGAGVSKPSLTVMPKGLIVRNYGYYSMAAGVKWFYVQTEIDGVKYTGFCSSQFLVK